MPILTAPGQCRPDIQLKVQHCFYLHLHTIGHTKALQIAFSLCSYYMLCPLCQSDSIRSYENSTLTLLQSGLFSSLVHLFFESYIHTSICTCPSIRFFVPLFDYLFNRSLVYSFIYLFVHSGTCLFMHSVCCMGSCFTSGALPDATICCPHDEISNSIRGSGVC